MSEDGIISRALNSSESLWLTVNNSSSPLCLVVELAPHVVVTEPLLREALKLVQTHQPYLRVRLDRDNKALSTSTTEIPLEVETLPDDVSTQHIRQHCRALLKAGICIEALFVKAKLLETPTTKYLFLLGDHMAFDGRSFNAWLTELMACLTGASVSQQAEQLPFIDWTELIPQPLHLDPLADPFPTAAFPLRTDPHSPGTGSVPAIEDLVVSLPQSAFLSLKAACKANCVTLNGPLMVAVGMAARSVILASQSHPAPIQEEEEEEETEKPNQKEDERPGMKGLRVLCAVDVRRLLTAPLPANYISSAAGLVSLPLALPAGPSSSLPWECAKMAQTNLLDGIEKNEAFRMADILGRGAFVELGQFFAVPLIWSNIGHIQANGVASVESHVFGEGSNPLISVHCVEAGDILSLTISYSPKFHEEKTMAQIGAAFLDAIAQFS
jgi:hypothetical protein